MIVYRLLEALNTHKSTVRVRGQIGSDRVRVSYPRVRGRLRIMVRAKGYDQGSGKGSGQGSGKGSDNDSDNDSSKRWSKIPRTGRRETEKRDEVIQ